MIDRINLAAWAALQASEAAAGGVQVGAFGRGLLRRHLGSNYIVLELKAVESLLPIHEAQLLTYLKLGGGRTTNRKGTNKRRVTEV